MKYLFTFLFTILLLACSENETSIADMNVYEGPIRQGRDVVMTYSEESSKKVVLKADVLLEWKTGDREFPEGMFIEFYDTQGELSSTLKADMGYYFKADNLWKATGDVQVVSLEKNQQLNSEELYWKPDDERIYTEKFVTIRLEKEVIYGTGLESNQDFTNYTIRNPKGEFVVE